MKPAKLIEAQQQLDQAAGRLEQIDAALEQQRAALATATGDDAELAALRRQRQRLLAERQIAAGDDAERVSRDLAALDRKLAKEQAAADEIGDTVEGLEAERARLAGELVDIRRRLADERHAHIVGTLGTPVIDGYLTAAGGYFRALVEVMALQRLDLRLFRALQSTDREGASERRVVQFLRGDIGRADLPRPSREFTEDKDLSPLPPDRPGDNWQTALWTMHELDQAIAARERELREELRKQGILTD